GAAGAWARPGPLGRPPGTRSSPPSSVPSEDLPGPSSASLADVPSEESVEPVHAHRPTEDPRDVRLVGAARRARMPGLRVREARGELRRLGGADVRGGLTEVSLGRCLDAVDARPELHDVQVELQDAALGE